MSDNIFKITDPQIYRCHLHHYHSRLSRLYVRCFRGLAAEPAFYLLFTDVGYVDAPVNWQRAGFYTAEAGECLELMVAVGLVDIALVRDPAARAALSESAFLYLLDTPARQIRIIAGKTSKLKELPPELL